MSKEACYELSDLTGAITGSSLAVIGSVGSEGLAAVPAVALGTAAGVVTTDIGHNICDHMYAPPAIENHAPPPVEHGASNQFANSNHHDVGSSSHSDAGSSSHSDAGSS